MNRGFTLPWMLTLALLTGCGTINTVFRPDAVASQSLKDAHSHCESVPRIYSGVIYGFCYLNSEPQPEIGINNPTFPPRESNAFPVIAIEAIASGVMDTLVLPYTIYRQNKDGSIEIYR
ncbi:YceK/YidQ family lipoprotein [Pseudomonas sp. R9.37]|uniref:YceK/YidQ family lipoprotein n=1 Tax=Pseudomonas sp. R9.37 TaxID=1390498 RepID=UPI000D0DDC33|nr:YceK/YidQ family lipoprotein [Pseudomonas sp. R9.37]PSL94024.1 YceK/YidQ family lipoprotein [Pseudomonas sp. R9.37]